MSKFRWKEKYCLGLHEMDDQHREIFKCLEELEAIVASGESLALIAERIEAVRRHSILHFASEEKLLTRIKFPGLVQQRVQHAQFIKRLNSDNNDPDVMEKGISFEEVHSLQSWILGHVAGLDREYAEFLRDKVK